MIAQFGGRLAIYDPATDTFVRRNDQRRECVSHQVPADTAVIQYSSGSTSSPKGCLISTSAVRNQIDRLQRAYGVTGTDVGVSWLPLYHDMGLFGGLLMPLFTPGLRH